MLNLSGSPTMGSDGESGGRCGPNLVHPNLRCLKTTNMPTLTWILFEPFPAFESLSLICSPSLLHLTMSSYTVASLPSRCLPPGCIPRDDDLTTIPQSEDEDGVRIHIKISILY
jgi:hypothetical protein